MIVGALFFALSAVLVQADEPQATPRLADGIYLANEFDSVWTHEYHVKGDVMTLVRVIHDEGGKHKVGWDAKISNIGPNTFAAHYTRPNGKTSRDVWTISESRIFVQHQHWVDGAKPENAVPHFLVAPLKPLKK